MDEIDSLISVESSLNSCSDVEDNDKPVKSEDNRIICSNKENLNDILRTAAVHVKQFSESLKLDSEEPEFLSRFLETFKDNIQENATINGLPYTASEDFLSTIPKENLKEETKNALFHELSKTLQSCAEKRKAAPIEYCRILKMRLKAERSKLKKATVNYTMKTTSFKRPASTLNSLSSQRLEEVDKKVKMTQINLRNVVNELQQIKQNINFAKSVMIQKSYLEVLHDTGYNSS